MGGGRGRGGGHPGPTGGGERGEIARDLASALFRERLRALVVTLGAKGAVAISPDGVIEQPAFPVTTIDTLGSGDAFASCLAVTLAGGDSLDTALRRACAAGALVATRAGVFAALPSREEIATLCG